MAEKEIFPPLTSKEMKMMQFPAISTPSHSSFLLYFSPSSLIVHAHVCVYLVYKTWLIINFLLLECVRHEGRDFCFIQCCTHKVQKVSHDIKKILVEYILKWMTKTDFQGTKVTRRSLLKDH